MDATALGMIETVGLVAAIEAADAGLKTADVRLLGTDYVRGGLVMVRFTGEVAAVRQAVDAGCAAAARVGKVFGAHVIARAMQEVFCMLASDVGPGPARRGQDGCAQCGGCEGGRRDAGSSKHPDETLRDGNRQDERGDAPEHSDYPTGSSDTSEHGCDPANHGNIPDRGITLEHAGQPMESGGVSEHGGHAPESEPATPHAPRGGLNDRRAALPPQEVLAGWKVLALRSFARTLPGFSLSPAEIRFANKRALMDAFEAYRS